LGIEALQRLDLVDHVIQHGADGAAVHAAFALAAAEADTGDRGQPFLHLAVEPVLPVPREQLQEPHDKRSGKTQKRRGEGRAHAAKLILQPVHQPPEDRKPLLALGRLERADRLNHRRNRRGEPEERAQKPEENQKVRDVSRDVAAFFHPRADRIEHRFGRGRRHLHPPAAHPADRRRRRQQRRRPVHRLLPPARAHRLDPRDRGKQLKHLPETGQHADDEDDADGAVEVGARQEDRLHHGQTRPRPR
jgi:hypothetical protein